MITHPYNFVPIAKVNRKPLSKYLSHKKIDNGSQNRFSGRIKCTLKTLSPFSIKDIFEKAFREKSNVYIPGSSLRGMIRSTMEKLYGGCGFKMNRDYQYKRNCFNFKTRQKDGHEVRYYVNDCYFNDNKFATIKEGEGEFQLSEYAPCSERIDFLADKKMSENERKELTAFSEKIQICPICALFGFTASVSYGGRLRFNDTESRKLRLERIYLPRPDLPRVYRRSFYFKDLGSLLPPDISGGEPNIKTFDGGEYNGRKIYLHGKFNKIRNRENEVYIISTNNEFKFDIEFTNLSEFELAMLVFALKLEDGIAHKLGYGKPHGMGSVKIIPDGVEQLNPDIYENFSSNTPYIKIEKEINEWIDYFNANYKTEMESKKEFRNTIHYKKFKEFAELDLEQQLVYPPLQEFFGKKNKIRGDWVLAYENTTIEKFIELKEQGRLNRQQNHNNRGHHRNWR